MKRSERDSLMECLAVIYDVTQDMQQICQGLECRLPPAEASRFVKETVLRGFSIIFEDAQQRLSNAASALAIELQNVKTPQVPELH